MKSKLTDVPWALTFDDITLNPCHSTLRSRKEPDVTTKLGLDTFKIPIVSSPMNTVTEDEMINVLAFLGGSSVLHRYMSIEDQVLICSETLNSEYPFYVAVGASGDYIERSEALYDVGIRHLCIDVANGHSELCLDAVDNLKAKFPNISLMAGNVCNYEGAYKLAEHGCDVLRVGISNGSVCSTRLVTGHGMPQLSALEDSCRVKDKFKVSIISDGGIRFSGDIVKALAVGADAVMIGNLLAGTEESPGKTFKDESGALFKQYSGMASMEARTEWFGSEVSSYVPEGVSTKVNFKGSAKKIVENLVGGLKVGMSYCDAYTLKELQENAQFVRVTQNGYLEGTPYAKR